MVVMVVMVVVVVMTIPLADRGCLCLAFSDQSGFWAAVLSLMSIIWFHHQLGAVPLRGADLLSRRRGLLVMQVVMAVQVLSFLPQRAVLIFKHFGGLRELSGL